MPSVGISATRSLWSRLPRTLQMRLTLLYGGLFLASGAVLLIITVGLWQHGTVVASSSQVAPVSGRPLGGGASFPSAVNQHGTDLRQLLVFSAVGLAISAVIAVALGWLVATRVLRPLRTITATAQDIGATNLHERLNLDGPDDELKQLGETLDSLFGRLEASFRSQRHFVANASHELRTPLTVERTLLQVALADPDASAETLRSACEKVLDLGDQQERLIDALLTLASSERGIEQREPFDLAQVANRVIEGRHPEAASRGIGIQATLDPARVAGDPNLVESLMANLVDNAIRHNIAGGRVEISTATSAGRATVSIGNTGAVIELDDIDRIFQPFERIGHQRLRHPDGHGLGLAIVYAIAVAHGATLGARARPEGGLDIEVSFPPADAQTGQSVATDTRTIGGYRSVT